MSTGTFTLEPTGAFMPGFCGGRRMSWMKSDVRLRDPWFSVFFIDEADESYYRWYEDINSEFNIYGRRLWVDDVADYEELALQMTDRNLWSHVRMLLVHVERPRKILRPIWPAYDDRLPYPSHINPPDSVVCPRRDMDTDPNACDFDMFRYLLEHGASPTVPRSMWFDVSGSMGPRVGNAGYPLRPGLTEWLGRMSVSIAVELHDRLEEQWVKWLTAELRRALA
ncbi:MAG: hypothetical protein ACYSUI_11975 [Planctomycetota bacterium]|jgi:hypothetical protein